jgi:pimeloyl-ACP methyl ester carboxylesterase
MDPIQAFVDAERRLIERYGLAVRSRFVNLPALRARVLETGEGEPLLFVHGGGSFAASWIPLMAQIDGFRLIAVDRPGCGLTDGFDYRGLADFRGHAISFLSSLLDALGIRTAPIVANSMGALWSLWLALEHPNRVSSLALLGCPALMPGTSMPFPKGGTPMEPPGEDQMLKTWQRLGCASDRVDAELTACGAAAGHLPASATSWLSLLERVLTIRGARSDVDLTWDMLRRVEQPTLFLWGDSDPFGDVEIGRRACQVLPNARLEVVRGGHLPWLDDPAHCGPSVMSFLAEHQMVIESAGSNIQRKEHPARA